HSFRLISLHCSYFFYIHPAPTDSYTLSLHDALPISEQTDIPCPARVGERLGHPPPAGKAARHARVNVAIACARRRHVDGEDQCRSEEHTSELQSRENLVCRLLLEKKKKNTKATNQST